jgi:hypothetical protein
MILMCNEHCVCSKTPSKQGCVDASCAADRSVLLCSVSCVSFLPSQCLYSVSCDRWCSYQYV